MRIAPRRALLGVLGALCLLPRFLGAQAAPRAEPPASRPLTLAEARSLARQHSPELRAARHAVEAAAGRERQAGAFPNPTLAYSREQTSRDGASNAQDIVSLEQPLDFTGQRGARRRAAGLVRQATEARLAGTTARIDYEVTRSYATAIAAERSAVLAEGAADAFGRAVRVSRARLAGGDVSGYQNRRLTLEAARYAALRLEALVARDSAVRTLASLVGLADSAGVTGALRLVDTLTPAPLTLTADSLEALALVRRAELRAAGLEAEAGAAEARLAGAERIPVPTLVGGYKHERVAGSEAAGGFVAGVSLPLPLWDRRGGAVAAARAEAGRREAEVDALRRQTAREVRTAFDAHQALAEQLGQLQAQLGDEALKARRAAEAAYAEGEITLLEWLDAVRAYHEAESTYAALRAEYLARRAALERATGAPLF
jgi:cobalt-zinc-cadmium efflux system outer membrane protein